VVAGVLKNWYFIAITSIGSSFLLDLYRVH